MTKLRYSFGGGGAAVRQPCAGCTGASYERSTEPAKQLPILGWRYSYNDERNPTGAALAGDDMGADYRLYAEGSGRIALRGEYRWRVGSDTDGGADALTLALSTNWQQWWNRKYKICSLCRIQNDGKLDAEHFEYGNFKHRRQQTYAHRKQVHSCVYVPAYRLTPKGVAV